MARRRLRRRGWKRHPQTNKTHHPERGGSSRPPFPRVGSAPSNRPAAPAPANVRARPPPARAAQGPALNLWPPGAELEAGAAGAEAGAGPGPSAGRTMTCYRGFLLGSCRRVAGGRAAALRVPGAGGPAARPRLGGDGGGGRRLGQGQARELAGCGSRPDGGFRPSRVVVVAKTTRYEFEQQRYRYAELSEEDLKQLVGPAGPRPVPGPGPPSRGALDASPARLASPSSSGFARRAPLASGGCGVGREGEREGVTVRAETPGAGRLREACDGGRGAPSAEGFRGSFGLSHPTPSLGAAAAAPQEGLACA